MSAAGWVCDSCETNNDVQARVCRVCRRPPGSVAGTVRPVPTATLPVLQERERPTFAESRHSTQYRDTPPLEPPRITMMPTAAASPVPPLSPAVLAPPPRPRRRRSARRIAQTVVWLAVSALLVGIAVNLGDLLDFVARSASGGDSSGAATTPCPAEVASWLPDGGGGAELVAAYTTDRHVITICRAGSGQLFYDGLIKGAEPDPTTHISIPATETATGYIATNGSYVYEISGAEVIVSNNGRELNRAVLTRTGP